LGDPETTVKDAVGRAGCNLGAPGRYFERRRVFAQHHPQHLLGRPALIGDDLRATPADRRTFLPEPTALRPDRTVRQLVGDLG
jgi:hypothetical protein